MLSRVSRRWFSGSELATVGTSAGAVVGTTFLLAGGFYALDAKIETKTNHLDTKLDALTQSVNSLAVSVARIEEHMRK